VDTDGRVSNGPTIAALGWMRATGCIRLGPAGPVVGHRDTTDAFRLGRYLVLPMAVRRRSGLDAGQAPACAHTTHRLNVRIQEDARAKLPL
jgi:hypothetical protein